jgi:DNA-binding response OmpR family regulator
VRLADPLAVDGVSVLIVDDDLDTRRMYAEFMRAKGWDVAMAANGRVGIDKTRELRPDAVVLDLAMPHVDGWTVMKVLRESSWTELVPIVVLTALTTVRDEAFKAGCDAFLNKPCTPDILWLQVRKLLRLRDERIAR